MAVDNTFASSYLQQPLDLGADIVMHSATKFLAGHSDVVLGALIVNDDDLHQRLAFIQNASGAVPGPMDSFLTLRGIKTLHVRVQRHCENGKRWRVLSFTSKNRKSLLARFCRSSQPRSCQKADERFWGNVVFYP